MLMPLVRYMILCDDWNQEPDRQRRITIQGLLWNIVSIDEPAYPLFYREFCVFLALTAGRGSGRGRIVCVYESTGEVIFTTRDRQIPFPQDPLSVVGVPFRIRDCSFPVAGLYSIQFWYNDGLLEERPLRLR